MTFGGDRIDEDDEAVPVRSGKGRRKKSVKIADEDDESGPTRRPQFGAKPLKPAINYDKSKSREVSRDRAIKYDKIDEHDEYDNYDYDKGKGREDSTEKEEAMNYDKRKNRESSKGRSAKSRSLGRSAEIVQGSPRRQIYEAKFDKFKANRYEKDRVTQRHVAMKKPDFDITTKNTESPSKNAKRYKPTFGASVEN